MKHIILIAVILFSITLMFAQPAKDEAIQSLDSAKSLIQQKNYVKAQDEINFALSKLSELLAEELIKYIPEAPAGWKLEDKNAAGIGQAGAMFGSANSINATAEYSGKDDANVHLNIAIGGVVGKVASLAALGQMYGGGGAKGSKSIRIAGYTGTTEYDSDSRSGKVMLQVGEKITVMLEGDNIADVEILKTIAGKIDLAKLEKSF